MSARFSKSLSTLPLQRLIWASCRYPNDPIKRSEGLTLIECLVAIVVIAITVVAITPPVFLATATRIQSRRAEQANQIAQKEIDRVRGMVERGTYKLDDLPASIGSSTDLKESAKPSGTLVANLSSPGSCNQSVYPTATPVAAQSLIPVDVDGDCTPEYAMQVFRNDGCIPNELKNEIPPTPPYSFLLGVRVYSYVNGETMPDLTTKRADLALTTGRRDSVTSSRKPLQTLYTRLTRSNSSKAMECVAQ